MRRPFEQAVDEHGPTVLRVCRALLGCGPDAEDAWSETYLAALHAWSDLDESTNVEAWLVRVAQRKVIDARRRRTRHAVPTADLPEAPSPLGDPGTAEPGLWEAVGALPDRQREALANHYLGGLPHTETAELTGSTPAAVRRAAADGLAALRTTIGPAAPGRGDTP